MLVTFSCPVYGDITMFGDVAARMLTLMGHSGTIPSAFAPEDVAPALKRLEAAIRQDEQPSAPTEPPEEGVDGEPVVSLSLRAWPLIELLKAAGKANAYVMWDSNNDTGPGV